MKDNLKEIFDLTNLTEDEELLYLIKKYEDVVKEINEEEIKAYEEKINELIRKREDNNEK